MEEYEMRDICDDPEREIGGFKIGDVVGWHGETRDRFRIACFKRLTEGTSWYACGVAIEGGQLKGHGVMFLGLIDPVTALGDLTRNP